jgi:tetratricopeptide (TPR) repeat protein
VTALAGLAGSHLVRGESAAVVEAADRALSLAAELGLPEPLKALGFRGSARVGLGDLDGLADVERAGALLLAGGNGRDAVVQANNLGVLKWALEGPAAGLDAMDETIRLAESRGVLTAQLRAGRLGGLVDVGRLRDALADADVTIPALEASGSYVVMLAVAEAAVARAHFELGAVDDARAFADRAVARLPVGVSAALECSVAVNAAAALLAAGRPEDAMALVSRAEAARLATAEEDVLWLPSLVRSALALGNLALAERLCEGIPDRFPTHGAALEAARAQILEARGELRAAAEAYASVEERWAALGAALERAYAVLGRGRCLAGLGDPAAESALLEARRQFSEMGASGRVADCDAFLANVTRLSS